MAEPRRLSKFTSLDGSTVYEFPTDGHVWEQPQGLRNQTVAVIGANYALDLLDTRLAPLDVASERLTFNIIADTEAEFDTARADVRSKLRRIGRGRLWAIDSAGVEERWSYARLEAMPDITLEPLNITWVEVQCEFSRYSHWYAANQTQIEETITGTENIAVTNEGNEDVINAVIELRANAAGGFQAFTIERLQSEEYFGSSRVADAAGSVLRIDCGRRMVEYAADGLNFVNDYGNVTWGAGQVDFLTLLPGLNTLRYSQSAGTPNVDISITFYAAFV